MHPPSPSLVDKLSRVRLVLMDIDGTLVVSSDDAFGNVVNQLRRLRRFGVRFSLATGRTISGSRRIMDRLRLEVGLRMPPVINYNGAVLVSAETGALMVRHVIDKELVTRAVEECRLAGMWPIIYACRDNVSAPPTETVYVDGAAPPSVEFNGMIAMRFSSVDLIKDDIVAILTDAGTPEESNRSASMLGIRLGPELRVTTSGSRYVEICSPNATKSFAMQRLAGLYGIERHQVMAIGDNLNDIEMIRDAGVGIAVGNAPAAVKDAADYVCKFGSAQGVVEAIRMLVQVLKLDVKNSEYQGWNKN